MPLIVPEGEGNMAEEKRENPAAAPVSPPELSAVIELGTTAVRMVIAESFPDGSFRILENLQQPVLLGRDAFTRGSIERETTEDCVNVLRGYQRMLTQYKLTDQRQVRVMATSAIREALNRDAVVDRIFMATGFDVLPLDDSEIGRYVYLAIGPALTSLAEAKYSDTLVVEVGGGSTDILLLRKGQLATAQVFRLGSFRLRQTIEELRPPVGRLKAVLTSHIDRAVSQIRAAMGQLKDPLLIALGGDARFAAAQANAGWDRKSLAKVPVSLMARLAEDILKEDADSIVKKYAVSYAEAEILGTALLCYVRLAESLDVKQYQVSAVTLRDGALHESAAQSRWSSEFKSQILNSAHELGNKFCVDRVHSGNVALSCGKLFSFLQDEHRLDDRYALILQVSAILHEAGHFISNRSHHKHSMYLIMNSDLFGMSARELVLAALVARYHRRAVPKPEHEVYATLRRADRLVVAKLAAILRVADALERGRSNAGRTLMVSRDKGRLVLSVSGIGDSTLEVQGLREKGVMFETVYGLKPVLKVTE
jgi:exopolyphosphatase / guanosine-5'-triphosphate,3'-diphosphate pyrophosphatase